MPYRSRRRPGPPTSETAPSETDRPRPPARPKTPEEQREALLMYAFRALGQRALSRAELSSRMQRRSEDAELIESVLKRLQDLGYLSDEQVAQAEARRRGVGAGRVRQKLRQRGVDQAIIEEAITARDPDDERDDARSVLERRWPSFQRANDPQRRAFDFLMRRGYPASIIWPLIRELSGRALEEEEPEE